MIDLADVWYSLNFNYLSLQLLIEKIIIRITDWKDYKQKTLSKVISVICWTLTHGMISIYLTVSLFSLLYQVQ